MYGYQRLQKSLRWPFNIKRITKVLTALVALFFGGLVYIVFRRESLLMFNWFYELGLKDIIIGLRQEYGQMNLLEWVRYNMPAALWLFSYLFIIDSIWEDNNNPKYRFFILILPTIAVVSEIMQFFEILPGTFDLLDVAGYLLATLLFITIKILSKWKRKSKKGYQS